MGTAYEVGRYLIELAASEEEPEYLTPLRLQKLLYYAQGWSLALRQQPLFPEPIEAWAHGPVVREVFQRFRSLHVRSIAPDDLDGDGETSLTDDEKEFVRSVWDAFRGHSACSLRDMTQSEPPWVDARHGYGPADRCEVEISHEAMANFFSSN